MVNPTLPLPAEKSATQPAHEPAATGVLARAFDGHSTQARAVLLRLQASTLHVVDADDPSGAARRYPFRAGSSSRCRPGT